MFWYDYIYELEGEREGQWTPWLTFALKYAAPSRSECQNIVVPAVDPLRLARTFSTILLEVKHVIVRTGTGQSVHLSLWLQMIQLIFTNFSANMHANQLQHFLDSKFEKKRCGVHGSPAGKDLHRRLEQAQEGILRSTVRLERVRHGPTDLHHDSCPSRGSEPNELPARVLLYGCHVPFSKFSRGLNCDFRGIL
jgi:hypothetical protein